MYIILILIIVLSLFALWILVKKEQNSTFEDYQAEFRKADPEKNLTELKKKYELGEITEEEYKKKKEEILDSL